MVGQRIKTYLEEHGLIAKFVAEKVEIPYQQFMGILNGTRKIELMEYCRICKFLKVDLKKFITEAKTEI